MIIRCHMPIDPNAPPKRRSIRLRDFDYSNAGAYFVTICTDRRQCILGQVAGDAMALNPVGEGVAHVWQSIPDRFPGIEIDAWMIMPNHLHAIVGITECSAAKPLGQLIGAFKVLSTRQVNGMRGTPGAKLWQRNFYEHVVRTEAELERIREYIAMNPARWSDDPENPETRRRS
jgi:putative transposase